MKTLALAIGLLLLTACGPRMVCTKQHVQHNGYWICYGNASTGNTADCDHVATYELDSGCVKYSGFVRCGRVDIDPDETVVCDEYAPDIPPPAFGIGEAPAPQSK